MTSEEDRSSEALGGEFARFAAEHFAGSSALYDRLARGIAADRELLSLAGATPAGQPAPLLLLASVHYLLLDGREDALAAFYPDLATGAPRDDDPLPAFRSFCERNRAALRHLLATRLVQTNEAGRCACLLPAFGIVAGEGGGRPLALVEIGASAGLNLLWDRYGYDYGAGRRAGDPDAPVQLACAVRGARRPPLPDPLPAVAARLGIDLDRVDVRDDDAARWLRALIWPEHAARAALLGRALGLARRDPPPVRAGDAAAILPAILAGVPRDATLCVFHTFALYEFPDEARARLFALLRDEAARRPFYRVGLEWAGAGQTEATLELVAHTAGAESTRRLARCDTHGTWLEWLADTGA